MELNDKIQHLGRENLFGIRKLTPLGGSYSLTIPKSWVMMNCTEIEGNYYLKLKVIDGELIFSPIDLNEVKSITIKEKR